MTTIIGEDNLRIEQCERFLKSKRMLCPPVERWSQILEFSSIGDKVKIVIDNGEEETIFEFINVSLFDFSIFTDFALVGKTNIKKENGSVIAEFKVLGNDLKIEPDIRIVAKDVNMTIKEKEKQKFTFYSVKYEENQEKSFYYISDIEDLKIGDYVWVPARDTKSAGIIVDIEIFEEGEEPFPLYEVKKIIRKISKEEYERFCKNIVQNKI